MKLKNKVCKVSKDANPPYLLVLFKPRYVQGDIEQLADYFSGDMLVPRRVNPRSPSRPNFAHW